MFLKRAIKKNREDKLAQISKELAELREEIEKLKERSARDTYVNEDGEKVPMSQVLNEYLYGKEEGEE